MNDYMHEATLDLGRLKAEAAATTSLAFLGHDSVRSVVFGNKDLEQEVRAIGKFLTDSLATTGAEMIGSTLGYVVGSQAAENPILNPIDSWWDGGLIGSLVTSNTTLLDFAKVSMGEIAHAKAFTPFLIAASVLAKITDCLSGTAYSAELNNFCWSDKPGLSIAAQQWARPNLDKFLTY